MARDPPHDIWKGNEARQRLADPLLNGILDTLEERYITAWQGTSPVDSEKREQIWHVWAGLKAFKTELTRMSTAGKLASETIDREKLGGLSVGSDYVPPDGRPVPSGSYFHT